MENNTQHSTQPQFWQSLGKSGIAGAVGTLGDIAISAVNNYYMKRQFERETAQEQRTYARNRADYLYDLERERAYNSPSQQLARLRLAGLNPNLMGEGTLASGNSSSAQVMSNGSMTGIGPTTVGNGLGSGLIQMSTADVARSRAAAQNASDYAYANLQAELGLSEKEFRPIKSALIRAQEARENGQTALFNEQAKEVIERTAIASIEKNNLPDKLAAELRKINADADLSDAEGKLAYAKEQMTILQKEYQRVENNWQKVQKWQSLAKDILTVTAQLLGAVGSLKTASRLAATLLPQDKRQPFLNSIDDILQQSNPSSYGTNGPDSVFGDISGTAFTLDGL